MRVMIVSEVAAERQRAATALAMRAGVDVVEVESAAEARRIQAQDPCDVLIVDGDLRPKGGFSLLYELRADAELAESPQVPAVVLVERGPDQWLAAWARADATVNKPVDPFAVAALVERLAPDVATPAPAEATEPEPA